MKKIILLLILLTVFAAIKPPIRTYSNCYLRKTNPCNQQEGKCHDIVFEDSNYQIVVNPRRSVDELRDAYAEAKERLAQIRMDLIGEFPRKYIHDCDTTGSSVGRYYWICCNKSIKQTRNPFGYMHPWRRK